MNKYVNGVLTPLTQEELDQQEVFNAEGRLKGDALAKTQYQRDRAEAYPPVTDYLDGIVKGDTAQVDKYIADCLAVKDKYPKGE